MQKKVMALAVAGALAAPAAAFAQASNVQIYGRVNAIVDNYEAKGGTGGDLKGRMRVVDQGSRFGVRGNEDLGGGLKAIFVIESGMNIDSGNQLNNNGAANASVGTFATRDSYVGLEGGFGRVTIGRQAEWYGNGVIEQMNSNYVNISIPLFSGQLGRIGAPTTRTSNVVAYTTNTYGGFNATAFYAPNSETATGGQSTDGRIYGFTVRWSGVVNVQADWAKNKKQTGAGVAATAAGDLTGLKLGVGWPYAPGAQISLVALDLKQDRAAASGGFTAGGENVKQRGLGVNWEHVFGNIQALAQVGKSQKAKGCSDSATTTCDNTEYTAFMVGGRYLLSKRSSVYVTYNKLTNKTNSTGDYISAGYTAANPLPAGADPRIWAIGVMHNF